VSTESNNERRLEAAVIGAGRIAAEHLAFLSASDAAELAAVCDLSEALGQYTAKQYGATKSFLDYGAMLEEVQPDIVHVCTPPHTHIPIVTDCLEANAHVVCEKPIAPTNAEFQTLWDLAVEHDKLLVEDQTYRFTRELESVERIVQSGRIGAVHEIEIRVVLNVTGPDSRYGDANLPHPSHSLPAGVIHEFLPHMTYLALRFLPTVNTIRAVWRKHGDNALFQYDDLDAIVVGGNVHARLRFSAQQGPECFAVTVRGDQGWIETEFFRPYLRLTAARWGGDKLWPYVNHLCNGLGFLRAGVVGFKDKVMQRSAYEGIRRLLELTYAAIQSRTAPPVTYDDMNRSTRLIDALLDKENRA